MPTSITPKSRQEAHQRSTFRAAVRQPLGWVWLVFLWTAAFISFKSLRSIDGVGQAVCGVGFLVLGVNAFLHPTSFNRPFQRLLREPKQPSPMDAALAAGGPVLIIVGVVIRWFILT